MARRIGITVHPNSKSETIVKSAENEYRAAVREAARDGKANTALMDLLARHFGVPKSTIKILRGHKARRKIIALPE